MSTPSPLAVRASEVRVRTTPLTCGCQASVATKTRIASLLVRQHRLSNQFMTALRLDSARDISTVTNDFAFCDSAVSTKRGRVASRPATLQAHSVRSAKRAHRLLIHLRAGTPLHSFAHPTTDRN